MRTMSFWLTYLVMLVALPFWFVQKSRESTSVNPFLERFCIFWILSFLMWWREKYTTFLPVVEAALAVFQRM